MNMHREDLMEIFDSEARSAWYSDSVSEGSESIPSIFTYVHFSPSHLFIVKTKQEMPGDFIGRCLISVFSHTVRTD
jgi:hypothetical protein